MKGRRVQRPRLPREQEPRGRERWLSAKELGAFQRECPAGWWPFLAVLFYTGARLGEVQGLRGAYVLLSARRIAIHEGQRRVKSSAAVRDLPIPQSLEDALAPHLARVGREPAEIWFSPASSRATRQSGASGTRRARARALQVRTRMMRDTRLPCMR